MIVTNTLLVDGVTPLPNALVQCELLAPGPVFYGSTALVKDSQTSTNSLGKWTLDLIPNLALNPSGTLYKIREYSRTRQSEPVVYVIYVPDTGGPYTVDQLITDVESPYDFSNPVTPPTQRIDNVIVVQGSANLPIVGNADGDLAVDSQTDTLWQWNGSTWISVSNRSGSSLPASGTHPGDMFYNTSDNIQYVWNGSSWGTMGTQGPPGPSACLAFKKIISGGNVYPIATATQTIVDNSWFITANLPGTGEAILVKWSGAVAVNNLGIRWGAMARESGQPDDYFGDSKLIVSNRFNDIQHTNIPLITGGSASFRYPSLGAVTSPKTVTFFWTHCLADPDHPPISGDLASTIIGVQASGVNAGPIFLEVWAVPSA